MTIPMSAFKRLIVWFWALWWLIAFLTDFSGALYQLGILTASWIPHSNYPYLVSSLKQYHAPGWLPAVLYAGIIGWSFLSTLLFAIASWTPMRPKTRWYARVNLAFLVSLSLWLAFFIADQIVMLFDLEQNHMVQGGFQLLTLLAIHLLPGDTTSENQ